MRSNTSILRRLGLCAVSAFIVSGCQFPVNGTQPVPGASPSPSPSPSPTGRVSMNVSRSSVTFGTQAVGTQSSEQDIQVINSGSSSFAVATRISGDFADSRTFCAPTASWSGQIAPKTHCDIYVVFKPTAAGARTGSLVVNSGSTSETISLSGTGSSSNPGTGGSSGSADNGSFVKNGVAALPERTIDTSMPSLSGQVIQVAAGESLQQALDSAQPGDKIVLQAGATFTGNFTLPAKSGSGWIVIESSELSSLPNAGTRVSPDNAVNMPKIVTNNAMPAITALSSAGHYRFIGVELAITPGTSLVYNLLELGDGTQTTIAELPHDITIDRCYIHGNDSGDARRGVLMNGDSIAIIDSYVSDFHEVGTDAQAIASINGAGPFKIVNNYLEGATENVLFGGDDPSVPGLVPSDIEFRHNHLAKKLSWRGSSDAVVKNIFELKNAQRVYVDGNIMEYNWLNGQTGIAVDFTPRNQEGNCTWCVVQDVTFTDNIVQHAGGGVNMLGTDNDHPSQPAQRIYLHNDLFADIDGNKWGGSGFLFQIEAKDLNAVTIDHVTGFQSQSIIAVGSYNNGGSSLDQARNFVFTNNLTPHNDYGVFGDNVGFGSPALAYFPGGVFKKNGVIRNLAGTPSINQYPNASLVPDMSGSSFLFVDGFSGAGFVDQAGGDYHLSSSSPFKNAGSDGKDIGADIDAINAAVAGAQNGSN